VDAAGGRMIEVLRLRGRAGASRSWQFYDSAARHDPAPTQSVPIYISVPANQPGAAPPHRRRGGFGPLAPDAPYSHADLPRLLQRSGISDDKPVVINLPFEIPGARSGSPVSAIQTLGRHRGDLCECILAIDGASVTLRPAPAHGEFRGRRHVPHDATRQGLRTVVQGDRSPSGRCIVPRGKPD